MRHQQEFAATRNLVARSPRVLYGRRALGRPYLDLQALKAEEPRLSPRSSKRSVCVVVGAVSFGAIVTRPTSLFVFLFGAILSIVASGLAKRICRQAILSRKPCLRSLSPPE